jgi:hypothetical protein
MSLTQINNELDITKPDNDCIAVSLLSEPAQQQVTRLLLTLTERLGEVIWPMPSHALHITLCEIIQPKPYLEDKTELLKSTPHYEAVLENFLKIPAINVQFRTIEVGPQAIIIRGEDNGAFNLIRQQLVSGLPLPLETKMPPDIIHSSIARYRKEIDVDYVKAATADLSIDFIETINEFQLLKATAPHLLNYTIARRYQLN